MERGEIASQLRYLHRMGCQLMCVYEVQVINPREVNHEVVVGSTRIRLFKHPKPVIPVDRVIKRRISQWDARRLLSS
jgi:hypothetical protein